jgi:uncharacterized protein (DUF1501 family)
VLIVIGMFGGNDGLNTVVPINDQLYYGQHRGLAIRPENTLPIDSATGLNAELTVFKQFWDAGQLAIVEGIGYPDPDLSHFNSMAKWMAGSPTGIPTSGGSVDGSTAISVGARTCTRLPRSASRCRCISSAACSAAPPSRQDARHSAPRRTPGPQDLRRAPPARRRRSRDVAWRVGGAMIDQLDLATTLAPLIPPDDQLSDQPLVAEMEVMARLVNANLGLRVLGAGWGDFDSHAGQPSQHGTGCVS